MDISRKLAIEFPDGTIRQFATITEAAQCIGVSVAAVSKAIVNGKDSVKGCKIRGLNNRMFVVRHRPEDPFVICRLTPFGVLKPLGSSEQNEKTGIDPYDCYMCKEIIETKTFSMSVSQRATCDMRRGQGAIVKEQLGKVKKSISSDSVYAISRGSMGNMASAARAMSSICTGSIF